MPKAIRDTKHWRNRAEEARTFAASMRDPEFKRIMLSVAESYDRLALLSEEWVQREQDKPDPQSASGG